MKLIYSKDTDSLYIDLSERPSAESREITEGVVLDYDHAGNLVGIDIDHSSSKVALSRLVVSSLPTVRAEGVRRRADDGASRREHEREVALRDPSGQGAASEAPRGSRMCPARLADVSRAARGCVPRGSRMCPARRGTRYTPTGTGASMCLMMASPKPEQLTSVAPGMRRSKS